MNNTKEKLKTTNINELMLEKFYSEYDKTLKAVKKLIPDISCGVEILSKQINKDGKIFLFGAYYLGKIVAVETLDVTINFGLKEDFIQHFILGGEKYFNETQVEPNDSYNLGKADVALSFIKEDDVVIVLCTKNCIQYSKGVIETAKQKGAKTILINNAQNSNFEADLEIQLPDKEEKTVGENISSFAFQVVLKMLINGGMVNMGKTYKNFLIDFKPTNQYSKNLAVKITSQIAKVDKTIAINALEKCNYRIKIALVMIKKNLDLKSAIELIKKNNSDISKII